MKIDLGFSYPALFKASIKLTRAHTPRRWSPLSITSRSQGHAFMEQSLRARTRFGSEHFCYASLPFPFVTGNDRGISCDPMSPSDSISAIKGHRWVGHGLWRCCGAATTSGTESQRSWSVKSHWKSIKISNSCPNCSPSLRPTVDPPKSHIQKSYSK